METVRFIDVKPTITLTFSPDELINFIYHLTDCPATFKISNMITAVIINTTSLQDKSGNPNQSLTMAYVQTAVLKRLSLPERVENNKLFITQ